MAQQPARLPLQQIIVPNLNVFPPPPAAEHDPLQAEDVAARLLYANDLKHVSRRAPDGRFLANPALLIEAEVQAHQVYLMLRKLARDNVLLNLFLLHYDRC